MANVVVNFENYDATIYHTKWLHWLMISCFGFFLKL